MIKVRAVLITIILAAIAAQIVWHTLEPMIPLLILAAALVTVLMWFYRRSTRW